MKKNRDTLSANTEPLNVTYSKEQSQEQDTAENATLKEVRKDRSFAFYPAPGYALLALLFAVPVLFTLLSSLISIEGTHVSLDTESIAGVFTDPYYLKVMLFTVVQALASTLGSLLLGLPGAYIMASFRFRGKKLLKSLYSLPFVLPSILVVLGFVIFYGNSGFLNTALMNWFGLEEPPLAIMYSFAAVIMAHTFYNFPVIVSIVSEAWQKVDYRCEQASYTLGASRARTFFKVTFPRIKGAILSAASLVFLFCFTSFAIILVLGGGPSLTTTEVEIYRLARTSLQPQMAAALSIFSLLVASISILIYSRGQRQQAKAGAIRSSQSKIQRKPESFLSGLFVTLYLVFSLVFILSPILSVLARSFMGSATRTAKETFSFDAYASLFQLGSSSLKAILTSLSIALCSSVISTSCALRICTNLADNPKARFSEVFVMLPMATSSVIIGLGYFMISRYLGFIPEPVLVVLAHSVICIPFCIRTILPVYRKIPQNLVSASRTLGMNRRTTFRLVEKPLLKPAILTGAMFSFALSCGELNATLLLGSAGTRTIPMQIYGMINSYNYQGACAMGSILIVLCMIVFLIVENIKRRSYV